MSGIVSMPFDDRFMYSTLTGKEENSRVAG